MKLQFRAIFLFLILSGCNSSKTKNLQIPDPFNGEKEALLLNTDWNKYVQLEYGHQPWKPANKDYEMVQLVLDSAIANGCFEFLKNPKKENMQRLYYRQYIPYINKNGEHIIEINAFCSSDNFKYDDWRSYIITVEDGGSCYWQIKINTDTQTYFEYRVNGEA